jgi:hypothetical protein
MDFSPAANRPDRNPIRPRFRGKWQGKMPIKSRPRFQFRLSSLLWLTFAVATMCGVWIRLPSSVQIGFASVGAITALVYSPFVISWFLGRLMQRFTQSIVRHLRRMRSDRRRLTP